MSKGTWAVLYNKKQSSVATHTLRARLFSKPETSRPSRCRTAEDLMVCGVQFESCNKHRSSSPIGTKGSCIDPIKVLWHRARVTVPVFTVRQMWSMDTTCIQRGSSRTSRKTGNFLCLSIKTAQRWQPRAFCSALQDFVVEVWWICDAFLGTLEPTQCLKQCEISRTGAASDLLKTEPWPYARTSNCKQENTPRHARAAPITRANLKCGMLIWWPTYSVDMRTLKKPANPLQN